MWKETKQKKSVPSAIEDRPSSLGLQQNQFSPASPSSNGKGERVFYTDGTLPLFASYNYHT